jgi:hypothetical protein
MVRWELKGQMTTLGVREGTCKPGRAGREELKSREPETVVVE